MSPRKKERRAPPPEQRALDVYGDSEWSSVIEVWPYVDRRRRGAGPPLRWVLFSPALHATMGYTRHRPHGRYRPPDLGSRGPESFRRDAYLPGQRYIPASTSTHYDAWVGIQLSDRGVWRHVLVSEEGHRQISWHYNSALDALDPIPLLPGRQEHLLREAQALEMLLRWGAG